MRPPLSVVALAFAGVLACKDEGPPPRAAAPRPVAEAGFTVRDLALAAALDAKLARLSLVAADVADLLHDAQSEGRAAEERRRRARALLPQLRIARAEVEQVAAAISNPADRARASRVGAIAADHASRLAAAAASAGPLALADHARIDEGMGALGEAIEGYRRSRATWRLDMPRASGPEEDFDASRRELERAEAAAVAARAGVAPAAADAPVRRARVAAQAAAAAARQLPSELGGPATRYAGAQDQALAALATLSGAPDATAAAAAARAYHAAKADALAALADYFAALAAR